MRMDQLAHIAEGLRVLAVPCNSLTIDPNNARKHPEKNISGIAASLRVYGQRKPLVVNRAGNVVESGNGTLVAARSLGWEQIAVVFVDDDSSKARGFALADNRTAELAEWDQDKLDQMIAGLEIEDDELRQMIEALESGEARVKAQPEDDDALFQKEFSVLVKCANEPDQKAVLTELDRHGLDARDLVVDYPVQEKKEATDGPELPAEGLHIVREVKVKRTARVMQLEGLFDVPPTKKCKQVWTIKAQLDRPWNIGLIVGASGSGKSTVAKELFGDKLVHSWDWGEGALVDAFPESMGIAEITAVLSSVGFSSPPSWLKPFSVLSNGEQFRATLARTLAESPDLAVVDEFTSVVDRTVAQVGSAALAKAVRSGGRKFIAVACHYDIEEWLQPDWKIEMPAGELVWRSLRRRPEISLRVRRVNAGWWQQFRFHHYLDTGLHAGSQCFLATVNERPAAFTGVLHFPHQNGGFWREHRTVCLPDFQGVGIGNAMSELVASAFSVLKSYHSTTSHPAMIRHRLRSPLWRCVREPSFSKIHTKRNRAHPVQKKAAVYRYTAGFEYVGPPNEEAALALGLFP